MKRTICTGILVMAAGVSGLMAQLKPKSNAEGDAVRALQAAQTQGPDAVIKAVEDLLSKYADTDYKELALLIEATAYQQKGDYAGAEITDERVLEAFPKNPQAALQLGELIVQHVHENDLDKEEQLSKSEKYINQALANLDTKPSAAVSDAQWEQGKKYVKAQLQNDLGLVALARKKFDIAIEDFKLAADGDPQPAYQVRLASAYQQSGNNAEALAICDKLLAEPQLHPAIRQVAEGVKAKAQAKTGAGK